MRFGLATEEALYLRNGRRVESSES